MRNGRLKTTEGEIARLPRIETSLASRTHFREKREEPGELDMASRYAQSFPFLRNKSGSGLRDEKRGGKQREIVEKANERRLRVYYLYTMSLV